MNRCSRHDGFCSRANWNREPKKFPSGRLLSCLPGAPLRHLSGVVHTRGSVAPMRSRRIRLTQLGALTTLVLLSTGAVGSACASAGAGSDLFFQEGGSATNAQEGTDSSSGLDPEAGSGGANGGGDAVASPVGSGGASDATGGDDGGGGGCGPSCNGCCDSTGNCVPGMDDTACGMGGGTCSDCTTVGGTCRADGTCSPASSSSSGGSSSSDASSGSSGGTCRTGGSGSSCGRGVCAGCCDQAGNCHQGSSDSNCGTQSGCCVDCTTMNKSCGAGTCS